MLWAVGIALCLSLLIACIEIPATSKTSLRSCVGILSLFYFAVLSFGNAVTTILASLTVAKLPESLWAYSWVLCPFVGVFGFEAILKNTNVTMFDHGVLTIQYWIEKARDAAAGAAIERQEDIKQGQSEKLFKRIMTLTEIDINTRILNKLGDGIVDRLNTAARSSGADPKQRYYGAKPGRFASDSGGLSTIYRACPTPSKPVPTTPKRPMQAMRTLDRSL
jgi:hypothetical protein